MLPSARRTPIWSPGSSFRRSANAPGSPCQLTCAVITAGPSSPGVGAPEYQPAIAAAGRHLHGAVRAQPQLDQPGLDLQRRDEHLRGLRPRQEQRRGHRGRAGGAPPAPRRGAAEPARALPTPQPVSTSRPAVDRQPPRPRPATRAGRRAPTAATGAARPARVPARGHRRTGSAIPARAPARRTGPGAGRAAAAAPAAAVPATAERGDQQDRPVGRVRPDRPGDVQAGVDPAARHRRHLPGRSGRRSVASRSSSPRRCSRGRGRVGSASVSRRQPAVGVADPWRRRRARPGAVVGEPDLAGPPVAVGVQPLRVAGRRVEHGLRLPLAAEVLAVPLVGLGVRHPGSARTCRRRPPARPRRWSGCASRSFGSGSPRAELRDAEPTRRARPGDGSDAETVAGSCGTADPDGRVWRKRRAVRRRTRRCRSTPVPAPPPAPRTSSTSRRCWPPTTTCIRTPRTRPSGSRSAPPGTAARRSRPPSTTTTSPPPARPSASTGPRRAPTARCSSAGTRTRCPSRPGSPRSRCSRPTACGCWSTRPTGSPRPRRCRTRSCSTTAAAPPAWPTAWWSPRRTTRHPTAASSTTRPTAGRPTPTPPSGSPTGPTQLLSRSWTGCSAARWRRCAASWGATTTSASTSPTCRPC